MSVASAKATAWVARMPPGASSSKAFWEGPLAVTHSPSIFCMPDIVLIESFEGPRFVERSARRLLGGTLAVTPSPSILYMPYTVLTKGTQFYFKALVTQVY